MRLPRPAAVAMLFHNLEEEVMKQLLVLVIAA